jgi:hypothetical protein
MFTRCFVRRPRVAKPVGRSPVRAARPRVLPHCLVTFAAPSSRLRQRSVTSSDTRRPPLQRRRIKAWSRGRSSTASSNANHLAFAEDPLGELLLEGRPADRGTGVASQVSHSGRERQQRLADRSDGRADKSRAAKRRNVGQSRQAAKSI